MGFIRLCIIIICIVFVSIPASAQFFRYIDENGKVRYTDNIGNVPKDQREKIREYTGYQSEPEKKPDETGSETKTDDKTGGQAAVNSEEQKDLLETKARLDKTKQDLEVEYNAIMAEKKEVDKARDLSTTPDKIKEYNQRVIKLNDSIDQYEKRQNTYNEDVQAYNKRLKELSEGKKSSAGDKK